MKVVIIGSGNVATVLGKRIKAAGHSIEQVIGKTRAHTGELAHLLGAATETDLLRVNRNCDLYIIAVSDNTIANVAAKLKLKDKVIVHTAGSVNKGVLKSSSHRYGVVYPLQSLKKELDYNPPIPVIIDGNTESVTEYLRNFTLTWTDEVSVADDNQRLKLHLAAVTVSNFTNHLYTLAEEYCRNEGLRFQTLLPLIRETTNRLADFSPGDVQTGPAIRGDSKTIRKHLALVKAYPSLKKLYLEVTKSIKDYYSSVRFQNAGKM